MINILPAKVKFIRSFENFFKSIAILWEMFSNSARLNNRTVTSQLLQVRVRSLNPFSTSIIRIHEKVHLRIHFTRICSIICILSLSNTIIIMTRFSTS